MADLGTILVIDDEQAICYAFQRFFRARGWRVVAASSAAAGRGAFSTENPDVTFLDVRLPDASGLDLLAELREQDADAKVIIITAYGSLETVMQAVKTGSFDYLVKPLDLDRAAELAQRALLAGNPNAAPKPPAEPPGRSVTLVGSSRVMQEVYKRIGLLAQSDAGVLILGETGTGKELVARAIHEHSARRGKPFVAVNCGAIPENLVESELFGHVRGAFTGASTDRAGRFEAAHGGTLLLDEVGELPAPAQVKLLRVLDSQVVELVGSTEPIHLDVRILAATNRDLRQAVAAGTFREDLYYRLAIMQIDVPALRDRPEDILPLAEHFLAERVGGEPSLAISPPAARLLERYDWPGNVRQLRNAMHHAAVMCGGGPLLPEHLPDDIRRNAAPSGEGSAIDAGRHLGAFLDALPAGPGEQYDQAVGALECELISRALRQSDGNQSRAAELLGLHRNTLRKKIRQLGLADEG